MRKGLALVCFALSIKKFVGYQSLFLSLFLSFLITLLIILFSNLTFKTVRRSMWLAFDLKHLNFGLQFEQLVGLGGCLALVAEIDTNLNFILEL